jgi:hypothetical protein
MGQWAKAKVFYGIRVDTGSYPDEVDELMEKWGAAEEALSVYILQKAAYEVGDEYGAEDELAEKTGIRVVELYDDGTYLAVDTTVAEQSGGGIAEFDMEPLSMEDVLKLEAYASWLGTETKLGKWFIWSNFS